MANLKPPVNNSDHIKGNPNAPVQLVEYGDFQCPHCGAAHPILKEIEKHFGDKLSFVFRHFPLSESHPMAFAAAVASEAAGRQEKFWEMHDLIYENQQKLSHATLLSLAIGLKMDSDTFQKDMRQQALTDKVESDFESGIVSGVNGTPTFYINGFQHYGTFEYHVLVNAINKVLAHPEVSG
jgi:protein-disulfide isomerase